MKIARPDAGKWILRSLLWLMAFFQIYMITSFSSQTASVSAEESRSLLDVVVETIEDISHKRLGETMIDGLHRGIRKLAHFMIFFTLGFILCMLTGEYVKNNTGRCFFISLMCGLFVAAGDEIHQLFVPGRSGELRDVCIDFLGVLMGSKVLLFLKKVFKC